MSYCEDIKVRLRQGDDESTVVVQPLSLKVTCHQRSKISIELTSESDLLFFYSVTLTESDFHSLKQEQRLLVDLQQFPDMVRQLVRLPNSVITLNTSGDCMLYVTETSQFREITHLSLKLRKGSDEAVKTYLAGRLGHFKSITSDLESKLEQLAKENKKLSSDRDMCVSELSKLRVETDNAVAAIQATCRSQLAELREDHARELQNLHLSTSNEYSSETRKLFDEIREKELRNRELERRLDESRMMLISAETSTKSSHERISFLEQQVERKDSDVRELTARIKHYEDRISNLSSELVSLRRDISSTEVCPKDEAIMKLQVKNKELKRALKETQNALLGQEKVVERLTREVDEARARLTESSGLVEEVKKLEEKLSESQQVIDSNSRFILYLNQQIARSTNSSYLGLPTPIVTPSIGTSYLGGADPPKLPDYPNRSSLNTSGMSPSIRVFEEVEKPKEKTTIHRVFKGPVKFTARLDSKEPPVLK